jgi:hypothetical protein
MTEDYLTRIPALPEAELRQLLERHQEYRLEAVRAALAELDRRGLPLAEAERGLIQVGLQLRAAALHAHLRRSFVERLGGSLEARLARIRQISGGLLAAGLGAALGIYLVATPKGPNPLGYEPEDTKRYLRDLELFGGKGNVLATEIMRWWDGLWHGRNLAYTVAWLTLLLALGFWFLAARRARDLDLLGDGADPGHGQPPESST